METVLVGVDLQDGVKEHAVATHPAGVLPITFDALADLLVAVEALPGCEVVFEAASRSPWLHRELDARDITAYELPPSLWHRRSFEEKTDAFDAGQLLAWAQDGTAAAATIPVRTEEAEQLSRIVTDLRTAKKEARQERQRILGMLRAMGHKGETSLSYVADLVKQYASHNGFYGALAADRILIAEKCDAAAADKQRAGVKLMKAMETDGVLRGLEEECGGIAFGPERKLFAYSLLPNACAAMTKRRPESSFCMYASIVPSDKLRTTRQYPKGKDDRHRMEFRNSDVKAWLLGWAEQICGRSGLISGGKPPYVAGCDHWALVRATEKKNLWGIASCPGPEPRWASWEAVKGLLAHDLARCVFRGLMKYRNAG